MIVRVYLRDIRYHEPGATASPVDWPLILLNSPLNAAITGTFVYADQGFASGVFTGAINPAFMGGKVE